MSPLERERPDQAEAPLLWARTASITTCGPHRREASPFCFLLLLPSEDAAAGVVCTGACVRQRKVVSQKLHLTGGLR